MIADEPDVAISAPASAIDDDDDDDAWYDTSVLEPIDETDGRGDGGR